MNKWKLIVRLREVQSFKKVFLNKQKLKLAIFVGRSKEVELIVQFVQTPM